MKTTLSLIFATMVLIGCSREPATVLPELRDRVYTVDEYLAQPALRKKVSAFCQNDPGRTSMTPNCINVRRADHISAMGTAASLHIDMTD